MATYCKNQAQANAEMAEWLFTAVGVSLPNQYGNQCSAAMQSYAATLFGRPYTETLNYGNAIDHIDNASTVYFDKVWNDPRDPNQLPQVGDIAVYRGAAPLWDGRYYGHTGAVVSFTATTQTLVQQDGAAEPTRLFPDGYRYSVKPTHKDTFAYIGDRRVGDIRGWLRPKWQKVVYTGADTRGYGAATTVPTPSTSAPARVTTMNGIDVSNWQPDIDLRKVKADFIGVLATDGATFKSPTLDAQMFTAQAVTSRTLVYHFARVGQSNSTTQAKHFLATAKKWIDKGAIPVLDWEEDRWNHRADWAVAWINEVERATGKRVIVYQRVKAAADKSWGAFRRPMWLSWYGTTATVNGYARDFSGMPKVTGWNVVMWQYADTGRLPGYTGNLDLNVAFGDPWDRAAGMGSTSVTTQSSKDPLEEIMGWYPNKTAFERGVAKAVIDFRFTDKNKQWIWLGEVLANWRDLVKDVAELRAAVAQVPASTVGYDVKRRGEGPQSGRNVNLATVLAFEQDNQVKDRADIARVLEQQALILKHLGINDENGAA